MNESTARRCFGAASSGGATAWQIPRPELVRGQGAPAMRAGLNGRGGRGTRCHVRRGLARPRAAS